MYNNALHCVSKNAPTLKGITQNYKDQLMMKFGRHIQNTLQ